MLLLAQRFLFADDQIVPHCGQFRVIVPRKGSDDESQGQSEIDAT
jgi:hypothetical protein